MIVPSVTVPSIQVSTQHQVEAVAGVPTETSIIARIPYRAVPATVAQRALEQDMRNHIAYERAGYAAVPEVENEAAGSASSRAMIGFSTPFMAQWLSQSGANDNRLIAAWLRVSRTGITPELMEEYSQVKYRPSNAGKPLPPPKGLAAIATQTAPDETRAVTEEMPVESRNVPLERVMKAPVEQLQFALGQELAMPVKPKPSPSQPVEAEDWGGEANAGDAAAPSVPMPQIRYNTSLIRDRGFDAYIATFSRNMLNADQGMYEPLTLTA